MATSSSVTFGRRSPELGDPVLHVPVARDTHGRPIRTTRGQRSNWTQQWVDPDTISDLDDSPHELDTDSGSGSSSDPHETVLVAQQPSRKRKREVTPVSLNKPMMVAEELCELSDWLDTSTSDHDDDLSDAASLEDPERTLVPASPSKCEHLRHTTLNITVNIPLGHRSPITLRLLPPAYESALPESSSKSKSPDLTCGPTTRMTTSSTGFLDLPAGLISFIVP